MIAYGTFFRVQEIVLARNITHRYLVTNRDVIVVPKSTHDVNPLVGVVRTVHRTRFDRTEHTFRIDSNCGTDHLSFDVPVFEREARVQFFVTFMYV